MRMLLYCFVLIPAFAAQPGLPARVVVEGVVVHEITGAPIPGARVKLQTDYRVDGFYAKTDAQGRFRFGGLAPAVFWIAAESPGFMRAGESPNSRSGPLRVDMTSPARGGTSADVSTLKLLPYAVITGKVTDPEGYPLSGVQLRVWQKSPVTLASPSRPDSVALPGGKEQLVPVWGGQFETNDQGDYRIARLQPGTYYVNAQAGHTMSDWDRTYRLTYHPKSLDLNGAKALQLAAGQTVEAGIQVVQQAGVRLSGRIVLPAGDAPPPGSRRFTMVRLSLKQDSPLNSESRMAALTKDGYEIADLLPGVYDLTAVTRDVTTGDPNGTPVYGTSRTVEVGAREVGGIDLTMQPLSETLATIAFEAGCAPADLTIQFMGLMMFTPQIVVRAGEKSVTLPRLAPGKVRIYVSGRDPAKPVRTTSIRLGNREVLQSGFDSPAAGETLSITVGCYNTGGVR